MGGKRKKGKHAGRMRLRRRRKKYATPTGPKAKVLTPKVAKPTIPEALTTADLDCCLALLKAVANEALKPNVPEAVLCAHEILALLCNSEGRMITYTQAWKEYEEQHHTERTSKAAFRQAWIDISAFNKAWAAIVHPRPAL